MLAQQRKSIDVPVVVNRRNSGLQQNADWFSHNLSMPEISYFASAPAALVLGSTGSPASCQAAHLEEMMRER
jgi:hypothetical protein